MRDRFRSMRWWLGALRRLITIALFVAAFVSGVTDAWATALGLLIAAFILAPLDWFQGVVNAGDRDTAGPTL